MHSLLFIPDISGFTQFVTETEIAHSRHIVAELLELLIDADTLGLTVAEIEGDAILFYKYEDVPPVEALFDQAREMFTRFHAHLKQYETRRICQCGACTTAHKLTLKIVAHSGPVEFLEVKNFRKPYGSDLILVHLLLKNDIPSSEYLLLTDQVCGPPNTTPQPNWGEVARGSNEYRDVGLIPYKYVSLAPLHAEVPEPQPLAPFALTNNPIVLETTVNRSVDAVYDLASTLAYRTRFNTEVDDFLYEPDRVNRMGTRHQCIVNGKVLDFETIAADFGEDVIVYGERPENPPLVADYALFWLLQEDGPRTHLRLEAHIHPRPGLQHILALPFRVAIKWNMQRILASFQRVAEAETDAPLTPA